MRDTIVEPPDELTYQELTSYISSLNDKEVIDNRTDVEEVKSVGLDRKISFRNILMALCN